MLAVLPLAAFVAVFIVLFNIWPQEDGRLSFQRAAILSGSYLILETEILSLFQGITQPGLAVAWLLPIIVTVIYFLLRIRGGYRFKLPSLRLPSGAGERLLRLIVLVVLGITALVAWITPPQTWDGLNYHMPRVAHWAQERAIRYFATGIEEQNYKPPGAEIAILQFYVLANGDRLVNFVQWFSMLGSLVVVSLIASGLGANRIGQLLAAVITAAIPMGIVQASSVMNDYVVAFWCICLASESFLVIKGEIRRDAPIFIGLSGGLAMLSKPTAGAFVLPFLVLIGFILLKRLRLVKTLSWVVVIGLLAFGLNAGHLIRNTLVYGNPIALRDRISMFGNQIITPQAVLSNLVRNAAFNTGTPWGKVNREVYNLVLKVHDFIGLSIEDPRTTTVGPYPWMGVRTDESITGNTLHAFLILVSCVVVFVVRKCLSRAALIYTLVVASTFLLFSIVFKWQIFGSRYQLPFFVLFAPVVGDILASFLSSRVAVVAGLIVVVLSYPWLFSIESRPLIPNNNSSVGSILTEPRWKLYFASGLFMIHPMTTMPALIREAQCSRVGIMLSGNGAEYPFWVFLGAPWSSVRVEWVVSGTPSEQYRKPGFQPCAVICWSCYGSGWDTFDKLPIVYDDGTYRLYMEPIKPDTP